MFSQVSVPGSALGRDADDSQKKKHVCRDRRWRCLSLRILGDAAELRAPAFRIALSLGALGAAFCLAGSLYAAEPEELQAELDTARETIRQLRLELAETKINRAIWKSDPEVVVLRAKLKEARAKIESLARATESANAEIAALQTKLEASVSKVDTLVTHRDNAASQVTKLENSLDAARRESKRFHTALSRAKKDPAHPSGTIRDEKVLRKKVERWKRRTWQLIPKLEAVELERDELKQKYEVAQQQAEVLERTFKNSLANREKRDQQAQKKVTQAPRQRTRSAKFAHSFARAHDAPYGELVTARAAAKATKEKRSNAGRMFEKLTAEVKVLREQQAMRQKQLHDLKLEITKARAEVTMARNDVSARIEKMIAVAVAQPSERVIDLRKQLAAANDEIAQLKAKLSQQSAAAVSPW